MPSIGGYTVITIGGVPTPLAEVEDEITRDNVDGHAYRRKGKRAPPYALLAQVDYSSGSNRTTGIANFAALQGTLVTIVDDTGTSWTLQKVRSARVVAKQNMATAVGGVNNGSCMLVMEFICQDNNV